MKKSFNRFLNLLRSNKLTNDHRRNLKVLMVACVLNFSFAFEKFFIVIGKPQSDVVWMCVYGLLGLYLAIIALDDYFKDVEEGTNTRSDLI